jgi:acetylornithine/N-succinyldiaminopimelate aminotransferase
VISPVLPTYARKPVSFVSGHGARVRSTTGAEYLDFAGGVAVSALGHAHEHLVAALTEQAGRLWHISNLFEIPEQIRMAERLVAATFADTVFFTNSGAEAVECAIKIARRYHFTAGQPERYRLITFEGAFHGRTLATIAAGNSPKHLEGFGPPVDGFDQVPLGDLAAARAAIGPATAGMLIEPIQGEGGIRPAGNEFLRDLRALCDEAGILLVLDEVQCGMGRTGRLFAHEWAGITPDVMAIAKALGGGFPVGACLATERAGRGMTPGTHGSTYGGNPLAMAVANAVFDVINDEAFLERVRELSRLFRQKLARVADEHGTVFEEMRGEGLMLGLKCRIPNAQVIDALMEQRVLTVAAGENVVRLLPPLNIEPADVDAVIAALDAAAHGLAAKAASQAAQ